MAEAAPTLADIEDLCVQCTNALSRVLPAGVGMCLMVWHEGKDGYMTYGHSGQLEDVIELMDEFVQKARAHEATGGIPE